VTDKLSKGEGSSAVGWAMNVEGKGWFGQVRGDPRGEFSFGPSTRARARAAVEAWLRHEPVEPQGDERVRRGSCDRIVNLRRTDHNSHSIIVVNKGVTLGSDRR
jgi:hypothetical protein